MILTENWRITFQLRWAFVSSLCPAPRVNRRAIHAKSAEAEYLLFLRQDYIYFTLLATCIP